MKFFIIIFNCITALNFAKQKENAKVIKILTENKAINSYTTEDIFYLFFYLKKPKTAEEEEEEDYEYY